MESQRELEEWIAGLAVRIVELRLALPAQFFLEAHLPLATMVHTGTLLFEPILSPLFGLERTNKFKALLSTPGALQRLSDEIARRSGCTSTLSSDANGTR